MAEVVTGTLFVVATPIGNLEDITMRALRTLREVALIAAEDTRRTARLLARYDIRTPTTSLHEHNEAAKSASLLARLSRGDNIALVSDAGTPTISDPGTRLIRTAIDAGIRVEPIPGPSAILAAFTGAGLDASAFTFLGFPPTRSKDRKLWLSELASARRPVVFFEAPHRIRRTLEEIQTQLGDVSVVLGRELTKKHEEFLRGPLSEVLGALASPIGEFTVVVDIGHSTDVVGLCAPTVPEFIGQSTEYSGLTRRQEIKQFALRHGFAPNQLYALIESGKKSVE